MDTARLAKGIPANLSRFTVNSDQCLLNTWLQSKTSLTLTVTEEYLELYCNNLLKSDTVTDCYYLGTHISNIKVKLVIVGHGSRTYAFSLILGDMFCIHHILIEITRL